MTAIVVVVLLLDIISGGMIRHSIRAGAGALSRGVSSIGNSLGATGLFSSRRALEQRNRTLAEEMAEARERAASFAVLQEENQQLRALLQLTQNSGSKGITAPIISSVRSSPYGTFLIGAGAAEGIARGNLVVTSGGFVVGAVTDIGAHTATVAEIFAPNSSVEAILGSASISAQGSGGGNARASAPRGLPIAVGDPVSAPSLGARPIGIVGSVVSSSGSAAQEVFIRLPVNLASLQYVYVISER